MSILEQYWEGVVDRLQAEVNILSQLIDHAGERGRENEQALQRVLERFLPKVYGLGTGLVIDSSGNYSRQMDLVIFDQQHHPSWLGQTTALLHPIETVYGVIEVKTTLRSGDIEDIGRKCRSVRALTNPEETVIVSRSTGDAIATQIRSIEPPLVFVLAYKSDLRAPAIEAKFAELDPVEQPDAVCVLSLGLLGGKRITSVEEMDGGFAAYLALLQGRDDSENRIGDLFIERRDGLPPPSDIVVGGRTYPVIDVEGGWSFSDPARVFVLFLMGLTELLDYHVISPKPFLNRRLPTRDRQRIVYAAARWRSSSRACMVKRKVW
jgi:hypothetical protein